MFQSRTLYIVHTELDTAESLEIFKMRKVIRAIRSRYKEKIDRVQYPFQRAKLVVRREKAIFDFTQGKTTLPLKGDGLQHAKNGLDSLEKLVDVMLGLIKKDKESNGISLMARAGGARFVEPHDEIRFQLSESQNRKIRTIDSVILGNPYCAMYKKNCVVTPTGEVIALEDYRPLKLIVPPD